MSARGPAVPGEAGGVSGRGVAPRGRHGLTREVIVTGARDILGKQGAGALSMRQLAGALGTRPMTLYHYFPSRSDLLNAVLDDVAARIEWPTPTGAPADRMVTVAVGVYEVLDRLPWVIEVLQGATNVGAPALTAADQFLEAALESGMQPARALALWRSVWFLISGELVLRHRQAQAGPGGRWYDAIAPERLPDVPTIRRLMPRWAELSSQYELSEQVGQLVHGAIADPR